MDSLRNIVSQMMRGLGLSQRYRAELILLHWREIVGEEIAACTRPGKIHRGVMSVAAKNAVWAHHLMTMQEEIVARINAYAGEKAVSELKFQAGYFQIDQNEENNDNDDVFAVDCRGVGLDNSEAAVISQLTDPISDEALRSKLRKLLSKDLVFRKAKKRNQWQPCKSCGVLCPPEAGICALCTVQARTVERDSINSLLQEAPWLDYEECARYVPCRRSDFYAVKDKLADTLMQELGRNEDDRVKLLALSMLLFSVQPQAVTADMLENTLAKVRRKSNVFASRS